MALRVRHDARAPNQNDSAPIPGRRPPLLAQAAAMAFLALRVAVCVSPRVRVRVSASHLLLYPQAPQYVQSTDTDDDMRRACKEKKEVEKQEGRRDRNIQ